MKRVTDETLEQRIRRALESKLSKEKQSDRTLDELVEEISIYHQELEYQNQELLRSQQELLDKEEKLKKTVEDYKEANNAFQNLFEEAPAAYLILDEAHRIKMINSKGRQLLEVEDNSLQGETFEKLVMPDSQDTLFRYLQKIEKQQQPRPVPVEVKTASGQRWVRLEAVKIKIHREKQMRLTLTDLTDDVIPEIIQAESEKTYREIFNSSVDALFLHDRQTGEILDVNDTMLHIFGYTREEIPSLTVAVISGGDTQEMEIKASERIRQCASGKDLIFEWLCKRKDGSTFPAEIHLKKAAIAGRACIIATVRDITDRKKAQNKLKEYAMMLEDQNVALERATEKAEEANRAKSQFLSTMNHEIRTPINGIMGFMQLLEETTLCDEQAEYIEYMNASARHLLSLANNVLDMAKIEAGELELDNRQFNLSDELNNALAPLYPLAREKGLQLLVEKDPQLPDWLEGDPVRLRQIILNLANNAVKFTKEGTVYLKLKSQRMKDDQIQLQIQVQDTGPGMDQSTVDKLFQPFFQERKNNSSHPGGTGLGLPITKELVERMDGQIHVHSTVGQGTTVSLQICLKESKG